jgi:hypothetical protein
MSEGRRIDPRWLAVLGALLGAAACFVTLLHLRAARPWLSRLGVRCPVERVSATQVDLLRRTALDSLRGTAPAPARPALGLRLLETRQAEVLEWASRQGLRCAAFVRGMSYVSCQDVPAEALGRFGSGAPVADLSAAFDSRGVLVGVDTLRRGLSAEQAAALGTTITSRLGGDLGAPTEEAGEWSASYLGGGALHTAFVRYRFRDYLAAVTATHLPGSGVILREQYLSAS